jgi:predicted Zn-dependent protease
MRALILAAFLLAACASPYAEAPDTLSMPKRKAPKPSAEAAKVPVYGGLAEPDTCKFDFNAKDQPLTKKPQQVRAQSQAQDAENVMAGADNAAGAQRRGQVQEALTLSTEALRTDPYSPAATYAMARAFALVGKKRCAVAMLQRLGDLATGFPDLSGEVGKLVAREKTDGAFEPFRKEADGAIGGGK